MLKRFLLPLDLACSSVETQQKTVTIVVVNNHPMIELKKLSTNFEAENSDIRS